MMTTWYVLHQSLLIALPFWLKPLQMGPVLEPLLLVLLTGATIGCMVLHELLIRRSRLLRPLFGLKLVSRRSDLANDRRSSKVRAS